MATSRNILDYLLDQLQPARNIRARKMFGEYALYCDDRVVALVCDDQIFVKITSLRSHQARNGGICRHLG